MTNDTIGVDVSKDHLDAHRLADGATRRFANDKGGPSKPARPPTSQAWRRSPDSQGVGPVAHPFAAVAPTSAKRSTCRPSSPLASIQT
jgi:transposase